MNAIEVITIRLEMTSIIISFCRVQKLPKIYCFCAMLIIDDTKINNDNKQIILATNKNTFF